MHVTLDDHQLRRAALAFTLTVFVFEVYAVGVDYSSYFVYLLDNETLLWGVIAAGFFFLSFYLFFRSTAFLFAARWPYKVVGAMAFAFALFVEYGYQKALGRLSDKIDIETAIASTADQQTAAVMMYLSLWAVIPLVLLLACLVLIRAKKPSGMRDLLLTLAPVVLVFAVFPLIIDQKYPTLAANAFLRTNIDFLISGPVSQGKWGGRATGIDVRRREVARPTLPDGYRPTNNVVVIVDESIMGDHFSLNGYGRQTTPFLDQLRDRRLLYNWGLAAAASTGSRFTYTALITGLSPDDFPDKSDFKVNTFPTIFQYAKAMGYRTLFFDGQMTGYWGGIQDDMKYLDQWSGVLDIADHRAFEKYEIDDLIAKKVRDTIYSSSGNFIFVFKHGAHIPYNLDFPGEATTWSPTFETENKFDIPSADLLPAVTNAYDNAIKYNVNSFFSKLADEYADLPNETVIIYTGDHGQTLFANGRSSHGGNTKGEATVPLFMISSDPLAVDTAYKASHANVFATVLDLIGYPQELRDKRGFPSLLRAKAADSRPRYFNPDLGVKVLFDQ